MSRYTIPTRVSSNNPDKVKNFQEKKSKLGSTHNRIGFNSHVSSPIHALFWLLPLPKVCLELKTTKYKLESNNSNLVRY